MSSALTSQPTSETVKGERGYELHLHLTFSAPLPRAQAEALTAPFGTLRPEWYARHDDPGGPVPSVRLTGRWDDAAALRSALAGLSQVRVIEVGRRGFLRSASGQTEWMPWRRNVVLAPERLAELLLEDGLRYVIERP